MSRPFAALAAAALLVLSAVPARAQTIDTTLWVTNGAVTGVARDGNTIYIGGDFSMVGPRTGAAVGFDGATGALLSPCPNVTGGDVLAVVPDGSGGWFIGGSFTFVRGQARSGLAQLDASGNVTAWNPSPSAAVRALAVGAGTVYVGGDFTTIAGQARNRIAGINATTGVATAFNPNADGQVNAVVYQGGAVYVGGAFKHIGGGTKSRLAGLDATTGLTTGFTADCDSTVFALAYGNSSLYVGGIFRHVAGQVRNRIAAVDAGTGALSSWDPNSGNFVSALLVAGSTVYVGGFFSTIGGQSRLNLAALDANTGLATSWNPAQDFNVLALALMGNTLYVGNRFSPYDNTFTGFVPSLRSFDLTTGNRTSWSPNVDGDVFALAVSGGTVFAGGAFGSVGAQLRHNLAALDVTTGHLTSWDPNALGAVASLTVSGSTVYTYGSFTQVGGQPRSRLAAIDATTGAATDWAPNPDAAVTSLLVLGNNAYVGGDFTQIGGFARTRLAAIDLATGTATSWNPAPDGKVRTMAVSRGYFYVGGDFLSIAGQTRHFLAAFDLSSNALRSFNPNFSGSVLALAADWNTLYVGGGTFLAAIEPTAGGVYSFAANPNGFVTSITLSGGALYVGGDFTTIGGQSRNHFAALDPVTGTATSFNPAPGYKNYTYDLAWFSADARSGSLLIGGWFTNVGPFPSQGLARVAIPCQPFTRLATNLPIVQYGTASWGDCNHDGRLDLVVHGELASGSTYGEVRGNNGGSNPSFPFLGLPVGTEVGNDAWGDYNGDGYLDLAVTGMRIPGFTNTTRIYRYNGASFNTTNTLPGISNGMAAWGDYDNDGDLDLVVAGQGDTTAWTRLYRNNAGTFTDVVAGLAGGTNAIVSWADYDNDGDLDLLVANGTTRMYRNGGGANPTFAEVAVGIENSALGCVSWGDYDNDGDLDLVLTGGSAIQPVAKLYLSSGGANPTFSSLAGAGLPAQFRGSVAWGDYDNDGDLDLLMNGSGLQGAQTEVMRNDCVSPNTPPPAPSPGGMMATLSGQTATFTWPAVTDAQTPSAAVSYNLRVGTSPGASDVVAPATMGLLGNAQMKTTRMIQLPPWGGPAKAQRAGGETIQLSGPLYWSVQAIDGGYAASAWSPEQVLGTTGVDDARAPLEYSLWIDGANPVRGNAAIGFSLPSRGVVSVSLHDVSGRRVRQLVGESLPAGRYARVWDGRDDSGRPARAGVYFVRLEAGGVVKARKVTVLQ